MAKKHVNRHVKNKIQARYDAAGTGRRMAGWNTPSSGPNTAITGLQKIRDRGRDVVRNEWAGASNARLWKTNIIGTGIVPRPKTTNKALKQKITDLWNQWVPLADADGVSNFYGLQSLVVGSWFASGEVFVRIRPRRMSDGLPVPMQIQVLEADMCPLMDADSFPGMPVGNKIRQGIEIDSIGRRVAYWFYTNHPGDRQIATNNPQLYTRVPAASVMHVYEPQRPGQLRGVSEMAPVIAKLRNVGDFDDAVLTRQNLANLFTLFVTKPLPSGNADIMTGMPMEGTLDAPLAGLEPGIAQELLPGEDVRFSDPPDAGANYADFMRTQHLGVAAGIGTPYELSTGDIANVSDRTLRIVVNEFRRLCEQRQWLIFIPQLCEKVWAAWVDFATLAGALSLNEGVAAKAVQWAPQGWAYIHPVQDVQAKQLEVQAGFRSRSSVIAERGNDPDEVDTERKADKDREDALGLVPEIVDPAANQDPAQQDQQQQDQQQQNAMLERILGYMEAS